MLRGHLASGNEPLVQQYGKELETEHRVAGDAVPRVAEIGPLLCAVERLTWTDRHGEICRETIHESTGDDPFALQSLQFSILSA